MIDEGSIGPVAACQYTPAITKHNNAIWIFLCYRPVEFARNGQIILALEYPFNPGTFPARTA